MQKYEYLCEGGHEMPGFITHYVFGKEGFKEFTEGSIKEAVRKHRNAFHIGLQGPDIFFYFPAYVLISKKNLGTIMHRSEVNPFFSELSTYIIKSEPADRDILIAYTAGFLGHQALDSTAHPYVYSFTDYKEGEKGYFSRHAKFETEIDYYMSREYLKMDAYYFDMASSVKLKPEEYKVIGEALSAICSKLYNVRRNKYVYDTVVRGFSTEISLFKDATGNKTRLVSRLEKLFMGNEHFTPMIIRKNHILTDHDILNLQGKEWSNYWNRNLKSDKGFQDLFWEAKKAYISTITAFENYISDDSGSKFSEEKHMDEFMKKIGNKSYRSGLPYQ